MDDDDAGYSEPPPLAVDADPAPASGREQTRWIQRRLSALGYDCGTPDGVAGRRTRTCIEAFQAAAGFAQTGRPSAALTDAISNP